MNEILLLEDDQSFGYILSEYLSMKDFKVTWVKSAEEAWRKITSQTFDLAIFDIMLPKMNGFELAEKLRIEKENLPFIFLSAKSLKIDKLKGYKLGAYDYVTKPVDEELLVAKIQSILSHTKQKQENQNLYKIGAYQFYPQAYKLEFNGEHIKLTGKEAELLKMLCVCQGQLLPRKKALREIWGSTDEF
ncbi:MAG: response regulator transcription factor, partial [Bacteroidota bacterium]